MITIFATAKPFRGHFDLIQRNAIASWKRIPGAPQILLMGNDFGYAQAARDLQLEWVSEVESSASGIPLVSAMVRSAEERALHEAMLFIAADTLVFSDLLRAKDAVASRFSRYCIVAGRHHIKVHEPIEFERPDWEERVRAAATGTTVDDISAGDVFLYSRGLWGEMPPFVDGRTAVDNWLFYRALERRAALVDATEVVTTIHQDHDYSHHPDGMEGVFKGPDAVANLELAGGYRHMLTRGSANWVLGKQGLRRPRDFVRKRLRTWLRSRV